jgi:hypothetical protein
MRNRIFVAAGAAVAACALPLLVSPGIAAADPDVVGMRYGEAKGVIFKENMKPVVATVFGDRVPQDQCFVVSTSKVTSRNSSGTAAYNPVLQVNLSCYSKTTADGKSPGFSAGNFGADVEAVRAGDVAATKKWKQSTDGQAWCAKTEKAHPDWGPLEDCHSA